MRWMLMLVIAASLCSCNHFSHRRLPSWETALALRQTNEECPVFDRSEVPQDLPTSTAYAVVLGDFHAAGKERQAFHLRNHAIDELQLAPDFMIYSSGGTAYAGSTSQYVGFGMSISQPVYRPQGSAWCYRIAPARSGITHNAEGFVESLTDEARSCGLLEGDTVVSIDGAPVKVVNESHSPWKQLRLGLKVGQEVEAVWIRPGTGRMSGHFKMQPNGTMPLYGATMDGRERLSRGLRMDRTQSMGDR